MRYRITSATNASRYLPHVSNRSFSFSAAAQRFSRNASAETDYVLVPEPCSNRNIFMAWFSGEFLSGCVTSAFTLLTAWSQREAIEKRSRHESPDFGVVHAASQIRTDRFPVVSLFPPYLRGNLTPPSNDRG